ncbi:hypothetical protein F5884DRAFT_34770 [Xylogone sp. PMI_703]|nr:hypothetical protein F5884DRAFT_34770 [Xylogone sp. PMI_703]
MTGGGKASYIRPGPAEGAVPGWCSLRGWQRDCKRSLGPCTLCAEEGPPCLALWSALPLHPPLSSGSRLILYAPATLYRPRPPAPRCDRTRQDSVLTTKYLCRTVLLCCGFDGDHPEALSGPQYRDKVPSIVPLHSSTAFFPRRELSACKLRLGHIEYTVIIFCYAGALLQVCSSLPLLACTLRSPNRKTLSP